MHSSTSETGARTANWELGTGDWELGTGNWELGTAAETNNVDKTEI